MEGACFFFGDYYDIEYEGVCFAIGEYHSKEESEDSDGQDQS